MYAHRSSLLRSAALAESWTVEWVAFHSGCCPENLAEEGYTSKDLALMTGWDDSIKHPVPEGYIRSGNIVTSVSYGFVRWALAFGELLGIKLYPRTFGL